MNNIRILHTGENLPAGELVGGEAIFPSSRPLLQTIRGPLGTASTGARRTAITHETSPCAPDASAPSTFDCASWPGCDCPNGTMKLDCPGLKQNNRETKLNDAEPDILEVLKRMVREAGLDGLEERAGWDCWLPLARAAIAKAEGST